MKIQYFPWTRQLLTVLVGVSLGACGGGGSPTVSAPDQVGTKLALVPEQEALPATVASTTLEADFGVPQSAEKIAAMAATVGTYFSGRSRPLAGVPSDNAKSLAVTKAAPYPQRVFRFYNTLVGVHFYTIDIKERDFILSHYPWFRLEGAGFYAQQVPGSGLSPVYRFYNRITGTHFYTASEAEKNDVLAKFSSIYTLDGPGLYASATPASGWVPIHRFYNLVTGTHFYTADETERQRVLANNPEMHYDGIGYYVLQGSDEPVIGSPVDKFLGNWGSCEANPGGGSIGFSLVVSQNSATIGALTGIDSQYATPDCTGAPSSREGYVATFTIVGSKTIDGHLVDKILVGTPPKSEKQLFFISNDVFQFGMTVEDGGTLDEEGFPNTLQPDGANRQ